MTEERDRWDEVRDWYAEDNPDGAQVLDDVEHFAGRFLALPTEHHLVVLCLWACTPGRCERSTSPHGWCLTPRVRLWQDPRPGGAGAAVLESQAHRVDVDGRAVPPHRGRRGLPADHLAGRGRRDIRNRSAGSQAEDLRALYDSGYKRGATVDRCEGDAKNMKVREFPVFAPVAFAGKEGHIPRSITSRAVTMHMRRRAPDEHLDEFRERDADQNAAPLRQRLQAWAEANLDALAAARPEMPKGVRDRRAEIWEALLAVADSAGGDWPERARAACRHFELDSDDEKLSLGVRLLRDIQTAFGDRDRMFSAEIVVELTSDPESEWRDLWGKPLDQRRLAKELKRYGIESQEVRIGHHQPQGIHGRG